jgi:hypothetical protein
MRVKGPRGLAGPQGKQGQAATAVGFTAYQTEVGFEEGQGKVLPQLATGLPAQTSYIVSTDLDLQAQSTTPSTADVKCALYYFGQGHALEQIEHGSWLTAVRGSLMAVETTEDHGPFSSEIPEHV